VSSLPVRLELTPSKGYAALLVLAHALAAACLLAVLKAWPGAVAALLVAALGLAAAWDRALLGSAGSPRAIEIRATGEARCVLRNGNTGALQSLGGAGVNRYWVTLRMRSPMRRSLLVTAGMLGADSARLLRLWALWGRLPGVAPGQRLA
jgi:hypothetical protein